MITNLQIVVISLNLKEDTLATIDSLLKAGAQVEQMIVVDNGSTDGTLEALEQQYGSPLQIIANPKNLGFSQACNQGAELGYARGADWVMLLNNDTEVAADFFSAVEHAMSTAPEYHILHPVIFYYSDPEIIWHMGARRIGRTMLWRNLNEGKTLPPNLPEIVPVDAVSACAMFIHRQVYQALGLFNPDYIIYFDEVEYCWRAQQAGFRMAALPRAQMWHKVSKTMNREKPHARYLRTRNQVHFYRLHARGLNAWIVFPFLLLKSLLTAGRDVFSGQKALISPLMKGWKDGWQGHLGPARL